MIFRSFLTRNVKFLIIAFKSDILPLLGYCSPVWTPHLSGDLLAVESVQRLLTSKLPGCENLSYSSRLAKLNLLSLEMRRLHADLLLCFKILHGFTSGPPEKYGLVLAANSRSTRGHNMKLVAEHSRIDARLYFLQLESRNRGILCLKMLFMRHLSSRLKLYCTLLI